MRGSPPPWLRLIGFLSLVLLGLSVVFAGIYHFGGVDEYVDSARHEAMMLEARRGADQFGREAGEVVNAGSAIEKELIIARHERNQAQDRKRPGVMGDVPMLYRAIMGYPFALVISLVSGAVWLLLRRYYKIQPET